MREQQKALSSPTDPRTPRTRTLSREEPEDDGYEDHTHHSPSRRRPLLGIEVQPRLC